MPGEGTIMTKSTEMVREFYRRRNFDLAPGCEVADHIIYELEFLGLLAESEESTDAEIFLEQFFRPWFGSFQTRVINGANHKFYIILVGLIDFFTREEK
jgi:TorA maturation chaperone TorD